MSDWQPIATAPRDGRHIIVAKFGPGAGVGFGNCGPMTSHGYRAEQPWMDVAHWFDDGFYSSSWGGDQSEPFGWLTHWRDLPEPPLAPAPCYYGDGA